MMHITEDTPPDMLAGAMDLTVHLPNGKSVKMSVERCTPMMDVLMQITTAHQLQLSGYVIEALGMAPSSEYSDKILPYKPNTPIGTLDTQHIRVVQKPRTLPIPKNIPPGHQPFESTFRLKVHLPRKQLYVSRVSMNVLLEDIMRKVCDEKNLDPNKYEFRHPDNQNEVLDPKLTLEEYKITEIYLVSKGSSRLSQAFSASDIMALRKDDERKHSKSSGGVFNLIFKRGKISNGSGSVSSDNRSISPTHSDDSRSVTPPAIQQQLIKTNAEKPKAPLRKRRPAPKPPQVKEDPAKPTEIPTTEAPKRNENGLTICHSRNSSDSSGYHEASILSDNANTSLPRRPQTMIMTEEMGRNKLNGEHSKSTSNLATMSLQSKSTSSLAFAGRKKKAPPPPPVLKSASSVNNLEKASPVVASPVEQRGKSESFLFTNSNTHATHSEGYTENYYCDSDDSPRHFRETGFEEYEYVETNYEEYKHSNDIENNYDPYPSCSYARNIKDMSKEASFEANRENPDFNTHESHFVYSKYPQSFTHSEDKRVNNQSPSFIKRFNTQNPDSTYLKDKHLNTQNTSSTNSENNHLNTQNTSSTNSKDNHWNIRNPSSTYSEDNQNPSFSYLEDSHWNTQNPSSTYSEDKHLNTRNPSFNYTEDKNGDNQNPYFLNSVQKDLKTREPAFDYSADPNLYSQESSSEYSKDPTPFVYSADQSFEYPEDDYWKFENNLRSSFKSHSIEVCLNEDNYSNENENRKIYETEDFSDDNDVPSNKNIDSVSKSERKKKRASRKFSFKTQKSAEERDSSKIFNKFHDNMTRKWSKKFENTLEVEKATQHKKKFNKTRNSNSLKKRYRSFKNRNENISDADLSERNKNNERSGKFSLYTKSKSLPNTSDITIDETKGDGAHTRKQKFSFYKKSKSFSHNLGLDQTKEGAEESPVNPEKHKFAFYRKPKSLPKTPNNTFDEDNSSDFENDQNNTESEPSSMKTSDHHSKSNKKNSSAENKNKQGKNKSASYVHPDKQISLIFKKIKQHSKPSAAAEQEFLEASRDDSFIEASRYDSFIEASRDNSFIEASKDNSFIEASEDNSPGQELMEASTEQEFKDASRDQEFMEASKENSLGQEQTRKRFSLYRKTTEQQCPPQEQDAQSSSEKTKQKFSLFKKGTSGNSQHFNSSDDPEAKCIKPKKKFSLRRKPIEHALKDRDDPSQPKFSTTDNSSPAESTLARSKPKFSLHKKPTSEVEAFSESKQKFSFYKKEKPTTPELESSSESKQRFSFHNTGKPTTPEVESSSESKQRFSLHRKGKSTTPELESSDESKQRFSFYKQDKNTLGHASCSESSFHKNEKPTTSELENSSESKQRFFSYKKTKPKTPELEGSSDSKDRFSFYKREKHTQEHESSSETKQRFSFHKQQKPTTSEFECSSESKERFSYYKKPKHTTPELEGSSDSKEIFSFYKQEKNTQEHESSSETKQRFSFHKKQKPTTSEFERSSESKERFSYYKKPKPTTPNLESSLDSKENSSFYKQEKNTPEHESSSESKQRFSFYKKEKPTTSELESSTESKNRFSFYKKPKPITPALQSSLDSKEICSFCKQEKNTPEHESCSESNQRFSFYKKQKPTSSGFESSAESKQGFTFYKRGKPTTSEIQHSSESKQSSAESKQGFSFYKKGKPAASDMQHSSESKQTSSQSLYNKDSEHENPSHTKQTFSLYKKEKAKSEQSTELREEIKSTSTEDIKETQHVDANTNKQKFSFYTKFRMNQDGLAVPEDTKKFNFLKKSKSENFVTVDSSPTNSYQDFKDARIHSPELSQFPITAKDDYHITQTPRGSVHSKESEDLSILDKFKNLFGKNMEGRMKHVGVDAQENKYGSLGRKIKFDKGKNTDLDDDTNIYEQIRMETFDKGKNTGLEDDTNISAQSGMEKFDKEKQTNLEDDANISDKNGMKSFGDLFTRKKQGEISTSCQETTKEGNSSISNKKASVVDNSAGRTKSFGGLFAKKKQEEVNNPPSEVIASMNSEEASIVCAEAKSRGLFAKKKQEELNVPTSVAITSKNSEKASFVCAEAKRSSLIRKRSLFGKKSKSQDDESLAGKQDEDKDKAEERNVSLKRMKSFGSLFRKKKHGEDNLDTSPSFDAEHVESSSDQDETKNVSLKRMRSFSSLFGKKKDDEGSKPEDVLDSSTVNSCVQDDAKNVGLKRMKSFNSLFGKKKDDGKGSKSEEVLDSSTVNSKFQHDGKHVGLRRMRSFSSLFGKKKDDDEGSKSEDVLDSSTVNSCAQDDGKNVGLKRMRSFSSLFAKQKDDGEGSKSEDVLDSLTVNSCVRDDGKNVGLRRMRSFSSLFTKKKDDEGSESEDVLDSSSFAENSAAAKKQDATLKRMRSFGSLFGKKQDERSKSEDVLGRTSSQEYVGVDEEVEEVRVNVGRNKVKRFGSLFGKKKEDEDISRSSSVEEYVDASADKEESSSRTKNVFGKKKASFKKYPDDEAKNARTKKSMRSDERTEEEINEEYEASKGTNSSSLRRKRSFGSFFGKKKQDGDNLGGTSCEEYVEEVDIKDEKTKKSNRSKSEDFLDKSFSENSKTRNRKDTSDKRSVRPDLKSKSDDFLVGTSQRSNFKNKTIDFLETTSVSANRGCELENKEPSRGTLKKDHKSGKTNEKKSESLENLKSPHGTSKEEALENIKSSRGTSKEEILESIKSSRGTSKEKSLENIKSSHGTSKEEALEIIKSSRLTSKEEALENRNLSHDFLDKITGDKSKSLKQEKHAHSKSEDCLESVCLEGSIQRDSKHLERKRSFTRLFTTKKVQESKSAEFLENQSHPEETELKPRNIVRRGSFTYFFNKHQKAAEVEFVSKLERGRSFKSLFTNNKNETSEKSGLEGLEYYYFVIEKDEEYRRKQEGNNQMTKTTRFWNRDSRKVLSRKNNVKEPKVEVADSTSKEDSEGGKHFWNRSPKNVFTMNRSDENMKKENKLICEKERKSETFEDINDEENHFWNRRSKNGNYKQCGRTEDNSNSENYLDKTSLGTQYQENFNKKGQFGSFSNKKISKGTTDNKQTASKTIEKENIDGGKSLERKSSFGKLFNRNKCAQHSGTKKKDNYQNSTKEEDYQNSTDEEDFQHSTNEEDFHNSTEKENFHNSIKKEDFLNFTNEEDFHNSTKEEDFQSSTKEEDFQYSTKEEDFQNSSKEEDFEYLAPKFFNRKKSAVHSGIKKEEFDPNNEDIGIKKEEGFDPNNEDSGIKIEEGFDPHNEDIDEERFKHPGSKTTERRNLSKSRHRKTIESKPSFRKLFKRNKTAEYTRTQKEVGSNVLAFEEKEMKIVKETTRNASKGCESVKRKSSFSKFFNRNKSREELYTETKAEESCDNPISKRMWKEHDEIQEANENILKMGGEIALKEQNKPKWKAKESYDNPIFEGMRKKYAKKQEVNENILKMGEDITLKESHKPKRNPLIISTNDDISNFEYFQSCEDILQTEEYKESAKTFNQDAEISSNEDFKSCEDILQASQKWEDFKNTQITPKRILKNIENSEKKKIARKQVRITEDSNEFGDDIDFISLSPTNSYKEISVDNNSKNKCKDKKLKINSYEEISDDNRVKAKGKEKKLKIKNSCEEISDDNKVKEKCKDKKLKIKNSLKIYKGKKSKGKSWKAKYYTNSGSTEEDVEHDENKPQISAIMFKGGLIVMNDNNFKERRYSNVKQPYLYEENVFSENQSFLTGNRNSTEELYEHLKEIRRNIPEECGKSDDYEENANYGNSDSFVSNYDEKLGDIKGRKKYTGEYSNKSENVRSFGGFLGDKSENINSKNSYYEEKKERPKICETHFPFQNNDSEAENEQKSGFFKRTFSFGKGIGGRKSSNEITEDAKESSFKRTFSFERKQKREDKGLKKQERSSFKRQFSLERNGSKTSQENKKLVDSEKAVNALKLKEHSVSKLPINQTVVQKQNELNKNSDLFKKHEESKNLKNLKEEKYLQLISKNVDKKNKSSPKNHADLEQQRNETKSLERNQTNVEERIEINKSNLSPKCDGLKIIKVYEGRGVYFDNTGKQPTNDSEYPVVDSKTSTNDLSREIIGLRNIILNPVVSSAKKLSKEAGLRNNFVDLGVLPETELSREFESRNNILEPVVSPNAREIGRNQLKNELTHLENKAFSNVLKIENRTSSYETVYDSRFTSYENLNDFSESPIRCFKPEAKPARSKAFQNLIEMYDNPKIEEITSAMSIRNMCAVQEDFSLTDDENEGCKKYPNEGCTKATENKNEACTKKYSNEGCTKVAQNKNEGSTKKYSNERCTKAAQDKNEGCTKAPQIKNEECTKKYSNEGCTKATENKKEACTKKYSNEGCTKATENKNEACTKKYFNEGCTKAAQDKNEGSTITPQIKNEECTKKYSNEGCTKATQNKNEGCTKTFSNEGCTKATQNKNKGCTKKYSNEGCTKAVQNKNEGCGKNVQNDYLSLKDDKNGLVNKYSNQGCTKATQNKNEGCIKKYSNEGCAEVVQNKNEGCRKNALNDNEETLKKSSSKFHGRSTKTVHNENTETLRKVSPEINNKYALPSNKPELTKNSSKSNEGCTKTVQNKNDDCRKNVQNDYEETLKKTSSKFVDRSTKPVHSHAGNNNKFTLPLNKPQYKNPNLNITSFCNVSPSESECNKNIQSCCVSASKNEFQNYFLGFGQKPKVKLKNTGLLNLRPNDIESIEVLKENLAKNDIASIQVLKGHLVENDIASIEALKQHVAKNDIASIEVLKEHLAKSDIKNIKALKEHVGKNYIASIEVLKEHLAKSDEALKEHLGDNDIESIQALEENLDENDIDSIEALKGVAKNYIKSIEVLKNKETHGEALQKFNGLQKMKIPVEDISKIPKIMITSDENQSDNMALNNNTNLILIDVNMRNFMENRESWGCPKNFLRFTQMTDEIFISPPGSDDEASQKSPSSKSLFNSENTNSNLAKIKHSRSETKTNHESNSQTSDGSNFNSDEAQRANNSSTSFSHGSPISKAKLMQNKSIGEYFVDDFDKITSKRKLAKTRNFPNRKFTKNDDIVWKTNSPDNVSFIGKVCKSLNIDNLYLGTVGSTRETVEEREEVVDSEKKMLTINGQRIPRYF